MYDIHTPNDADWKHKNASILTTTFLNKQWNVVICLKVSVQKQRVNLQYIMSYDKTRFQCLLSSENSFCMSKPDSFTKIGKHLNQI